MKKTLTKKVIPILDSHYADISIFHNLKVYNGEIKDEVVPPSKPNCFLGAWYHKVYSAKDSWMGIEGIVRLGEFVHDPKRYGSDNRVDYHRSLDNPSIYMGGQATAESDAGLNLNCGYVSADTSEELNYGSKKIAYRPFWRYIYETIDDNFGNVTRNGVNVWAVTDPTQLEYYYFPGDLVKMSVYSPVKNYLQLKIDVLEPTNIQKYSNLRKKYGVKDNVLPIFYSPLFYSEGHGHQKAEFKRVNSIDQYGNEGNNAVLTKAYVTETNWHEVYLYRKIQGQLVKVPFNNIRQVVMNCPNNDSFTIIKSVKQEDFGGESITIHPKMGDYNE